MRMAGVASCRPRLWRATDCECLRSLFANALVGRPNRLVIASTIILATASGCKPVRNTPASDLVIFGSRGGAPGKFLEPRVIAAAPSGLLYVIDTSGRVQQFSAQGNMIRQWSLPSHVRGRPSGACVDEAGRILVADTHNSRILVYDADGTEVWRFGERGMGPGEFMLPTDVTVDHDGHIYICEYGGNDRVSKLSKDGQFLLSFGGLDSGDAALMRPSAVAIDLNGNVLVADTSNHRICRFSPAGQLIQTFAELGKQAGQLRYPRDVVVLPDGSIVVVDYGNSRLVRFGADGTTLATWGSPGRGQGQLFAPLNVAFTGGRCYVADSRNNRVVGVDFGPLMEASLASAE